VVEVLGIGQSSDGRKLEEDHHRLPLFQGILPLDASKLTPDIVAGITLAALGIPEVLGYAKIAQMPWSRASARS
jgi:hypothetical protein